MIGDVDFFAQNFLLREAEDNCYYGLKTSWYKRCIGMANSPEFLVGDTAPLSNWISELLFHLLQWLGLNLRNIQAEWPSKWTIDVLSKLISKRFHSQGKLFGTASDLPIYIEKIKSPFREGTNSLKVVMVQPLLPKKNDFLKHGILLNGLDYRVRHREHVMNLSKLVFDKLNAFEQANCPRPSSVRCTSSIVNLPHFGQSSFSQILDALTFHQSKLAHVTIKDRFALLTFKIDFQLFLLSRLISPTGYCTDQDIM